MVEPLRPRKIKQLQLLDSPKTSITYFEERFCDQGLIAGVDEAGRGCLAGPVVAASVILPKGISIPDINDSKQLTAKERDYFYDVIREKALAWSVGVIDAWEIDRINILRASLKAMQEAVSKLKPTPAFLFIDGIQPIESAIPQKIFKKGDARCISIAAASIMAKVTRDRMMTDYEKRYPKFSFSIHKGYGTELHMKELATHGPTPIHRMTFAPLSSKVSDT